MKTFTFEGDMNGVDAATITFNKAQLAIMADIVVPVIITRTQQFRNAESTHNIMGLYEAMDANTKTKKFRKTAYTPLELMEMVLGANLTAR
jgi:hypothetical protein